VEGIDGLHPEPPMLRREGKNLPHDLAHVSIRAGLPRRIELLLFRRWTARGLFFHAVEDDTPSEASSIWNKIREQRDQVVDEVPGGLVPIFWYLLKQFSNNPIPPAGQLRAQGARLHWGRCDVGHGNFGGSLSWERQFTGQHFEEDDSQGVEICPLIDGLSQKNLGCRVGQGGLHLTGLGDQGFLSHETCESEIHDSGTTIGFEQDVSRLEISMKKTLSMQMIKPFQDVHEDLISVSHREESAPDGCRIYVYMDCIVEASSLDQFADDGLDPRLTDRLDES